MATYIEEGKTDVMWSIEVNFFNLLRARQLAIIHQLWNSVVSCMRALKYYFLERPAAAAEWEQLVNELIPLFADPATDAPAPNRGDEWVFLTEYRVDMALRRKRRDAAMRLQTLLVDFHRRKLQNSGTNEDKRTALRNLAFGLYGRAKIKAEPAERIGDLKEALVLHEHAEDKAGILRCVEGLALTYLSLDNFEEAENWCAYGLKRLNPEETASAAIMLTKLGRIHYEHFQYLTSIQGGGEEFQRAKWEKAQSCLLKAVKPLKAALAMTPEVRYTLFGELHSLLGNVLTHLRIFDQAFTHLQESIKLDEDAGLIERAMTTRLELAIMLINSKRFAAARQYVFSVLQFARYNPEWRYKENDVLQLLHIIENQEKRDKEYETH
jgi:tetratricopeptide (TPR) repeat protein